MDNVDKVIQKMNYIIDVPDYIERRDCYNITRVKGPYGWSEVVVFCHGDDPNDTLVIGVVGKDGTIDRIIWNNDGWHLLMA